jgi:hypothetical protein
MQQQQQQLQKLPPASISPQQPSPTISSSSIKKSSTKDQAPLAPSTSSSHTHIAVDDDSNDIENFDIIACSVQRRDDFPGIGLSLSTAVNNPNRSVSPSSYYSSSKSPSTKLSENEADNLQHLPIITNIDEKSPADMSGLKVGDLVLEINGKSTNGQTNSNIAKWIRSSGTTIEFVVSRVKHLNHPPKLQQQQQQIKDNAKIIAQEAIQVAKTKVPDYLYHKEQEQNVDDLKLRKPNENLHQIMVEAIQSNKNAKDITPPPPPSSSSTHLSRKDSMTQQQRRPSLNATPPSSSSSQLEIQQMSSSKLQQDPVKTSSNRNQSEPPAPLGKPAIVSSSSSLSINSIEQSQSQHSPSLSHTHHHHHQQQQQQQINLVKQRSQSSFTLPRDAPIPRLCRVRAYEDQLGFTVAGSKANRGVFKV